MNTIEKLSRRRFLDITGKSGGALIIGGSFGLSACSKESASNSAPVSNVGPQQLGVFVSIDGNGLVDIVCHRAEMGQGILTSVPQLIAEELCADWDKVSVSLGGADSRYGDQSTGGSASIRSHFAHIRQMGAIARDMLEQAAAQVWQVDKSEVKAAKHQVTHSSGKSMSFGELAELAGTMTPAEPASVSLKPLDQYTLVGKDVELAGQRNIVTGQATYAQDIQVPNMLIASIERPPVVAGTVASFDASEALKVPGVVQVFKLKERGLPVNVKPVGGIAVLAENTWAALEGRKKLKIEWNHGENAIHDSEAYKAELVKKVSQPGISVRKVGDADGHEYKADQTVEATYTVPYHHHMSMETPAATVVFEGDICKVWSGTQTPQWGKNLVLEELGLDPQTDGNKVEFNQCLMGGAFGRKGKNDFTVEAVELAVASGRPVKVIWSREDDVKHGFYHSIAANYCKAEVTENKTADFWVQRVCLPPIGWIFNNNAEGPGDGDMALGFADIPFALNNLSCEKQNTPTHVRCGWLRAVGNINNAFALGCFVDELAAKANVAPRQMWHNLLGDNRLVDPKKEGFPAYHNYGHTTEDYLIDIARCKAVIDTVVEKSGAEGDTAENEGWGISFAQSFSSYAAAATKVRVTDGNLEILEMHTAIDCGLAITPDRVKSQMEGAMIMGVSLALHSEITLKDGIVEQSNFHDYPTARINQVPNDLHVHIVDSGGSPGGVGEPGLPPVMPSIANAIFRASGQRIRDLPIKDHLSV